MAKVNTYDKDESLNIKLNKTHLGKAKKYISPYKKEFILTFIVLIFATVANMSAPYLIQNALDVQIPNKSIKGLIILGALFVLIAVIAVFSGKFRMKYMNYVGQSIIYDIRKDLFEHLQKLPFSYYDSRPHGKILVRVVNYVNSLADMFSNGIINSIMEMISLIVILVYMFLINVKLTLISLIGLPVLIFAIGLLKNIHRRAWQAYSDKNSNLNAYLHESINGVRITQAFVREKKNKRIFKRLALDTFKNFMKAKSIEFLIWPMTSVISEFTICLVYFVAVAAISKDPEAFKVGVIVAIISYIQRFWTPINNISNVYNSVMTNAAYLERIFETMEEEVVIEDKKDAYVLPDVSGEVEFKNVTFGYDIGRNILENVSFKAEIGQTIALVGPTGAGKTTIVNLLSRYYDISDGQILIDGHDISKVTVKSLRDKLGYMLQDSFIFSGTIIDNIRYGRLDATDEEVIEAAKSVSAHDFIDNMKDKYYTHVSERGSTLSAGQRQLISLARAMLRNPEILILDEATSSIDTETEKNLIDGIQKLLKDRTSFVIAHRLSTIRTSDRIMVIGNKGIMEQGTHEELMAIEGEYYKMYTSQHQL